jgi:predicted Rossmann-fold nucleotide-binding protein
MKEHTLKVFENRVLRNIFGSKREEVTGDCRKLCKELYYLCSWSNNIVSGMKSGTMGKGNVTVMSEKTNAFSVLFGNREGKRPLGRHRNR